MSATARPATRVAIAVAIPFVACAVQWLLWDYFKPYVWFLFFPAAFFSAWIGGFVGGFAATLIGALLVWYFFIPPALSFQLKNLAAGYSIAVFVFMGSLFAWFHERLQHSMRRTDEALATAEAANDKITQLYEKTLELDGLKSQFFANVSHELRTPLTLILAPLERRLRAPAQALSEAERHETETMLRNARLLYRHVTDLLDAAKLEAGRMTLAWARLDLAYVVRTMASHFESVAADRNIAYTVSTPDALPAEADNEKLQRILINLLSNAYKFTPDGGAIAVRLIQEEGHALIQVQDNGPGVPAALRLAVFERFRQGQGDVRRRHGGTGLGLAIVHDFVTLHGGKVWVEEAPGGGALFSVRLPLAAPAGTVLGAPMAVDEVIGRQSVEELETHAVTRTEISPGETPLVLVVEDNADMNEFIAATLRPHYRVASAFDGREGLDKALTLQPALILSDVMMPVMSGDEMVHALRSQTSTRDLPIIMLTAKADDELRIGLLKDGVQDYLNKPFSVEELLARVGGLVASRRRTQDELRRYEQIVATSGDMLAFIDREHRYQVVNPAYAELFGSTPDRLRQSLVEDVVGSATYLLIKPHLERAISGKIDRFTIEPTFLDQRKRVLDAEYRPFSQYGKVQGVVVSLRDITHLKEAEAALRESQEQLQLFIEHAPAALAMFDRDMRYLAVSRRWMEDYGLGDAHIVGRSHYDVFPEITDAWKAAHRRGLAGEVIRADEDRFLREDGHVQWLRWEVRPWHTSADTVGGIVVFSEDITAYKQVTEEIRQLNASLEQRVEQRTAELTAANRELDAFAYAVSHDLRAPVRAMNGFTQALEEDYGDQLEGDGKAYLEQIGIASRKMGELIEGILLLSRSTRGELRHDRVDLTAVSRRLLAELAAGDPARSVKADIEPGLVAHGDARMIEALMRNLLGNAWKYTSRAEAPALRIYAGEMRGQPGICVADNGAGFDMAHAENLFQPFRRLHRQDEFPGLGIGLATVQRIIHRHGGEISAQAAPGEGATFCFTLPTAAGMEGGGDAHVAP
ncbi:MAG: ATP-binding protein [Rhodocyclaceae bacterium]|nr:ATP-binding protein [Rhodocyclaceae bacterium]